MAVINATFKYNEGGHTYHALVGFLPRVYPHVDEKLVAGIERLVTSHAARPETGKLLPFPLVYVRLLDVPHQLFLVAICCTAVDPATLALLVHHHVRSRKPGRLKRRAVLTSQALLALEGLVQMEQLPLSMVAELKQVGLTC